MSPSLLFCKIHLNQPERVKRYTLRDGLHLRSDAPQVRRAAVLRDRAPQLPAPGLADGAKEIIKSVPPALL